MKVVCIKDNWGAVDGETFKPVKPMANTPKKGNIYVVVERVNFYGLCYILEEYPPDVCFVCEFFRPVTDISDLEKLCEVEPLKHVEPVS